MPERFNFSSAFGGFRFSLSFRTSDLFVRREPHSRKDLSFESTLGGFARLNPRLFDEDVVTGLNADSGDDFLQGDPGKHHAATFGRLDASGINRDRLAAVRNTFHAGTEEFPLYLHGLRLIRRQNFHSIFREADSDTNFLHRFGKGPTVQRH